MIADNAGQHDKVGKGPALVQGTFFGWHVAWAAFTVAIFGWGVGFYGPSVFLNSLHATRGWPISVISSAITCHFLISATIISRLPAIYRRFGLVKVTRIGAVALAFGVLGWALASQPWHLFAAALLTGIGWSATSGAAINAMVAPWFERRRPAALSMAFNGASVGGFVFTPLWAVLIPSLGFVTAAFSVGLVTGAILWWVAGRFLRPTPGSLGLAPDGVVRPSMEDSSIVLEPTPRRAPLPTGIRVWCDWRFATLSAAFSLGLFAQIGLISHLISLLAPALGEGGAGAMLSLVAVCGVVGRTLLGGVLHAGADRRGVAAINFAVQIGGSMALLLAGGSSFPLLLVGCVLFGLGVGNLVLLPPLIAQNEFASADVARVVALVIAINQAVFAFAPAALGLLRDAIPGGWVPVVAVGLIQCTATAVVLLGRQRLNRPRTAFAISASRGGLSR